MQSSWTVVLVRLRSLAGVLVTNVECTTVFMKSFPTYETMFSDNPRYSSFLVHSQNYTNDKPKMLELSQGPIRSIRVAHVNNVSPPPPASKESRNAGISTKDLLGRYRSRYFASPIKTSPAPQEPTLPSITCYPEAKSEFHTEVVPPTPPFRDNGTQTDYRDSEAQTDPYSPPYFIQPGSNPEILLLKDLKWGKGLPAGKLEVEMIQRARERRAGRANLEKCMTNDVKKLRKVLQSTDVPVEAIFYKEQRLKVYQDKRLELLAKSLQDLRERHGDLIQDRLQTLWKRRHREYDQKFNKMQADKSREIRRLQSRLNGSTTPEVSEDHLPKIVTQGYKNNNNNNSISKNNNNNNIEEYIGKGKGVNFQSKKDIQARLKTARMNHTSNITQYPDNSWHFLPDFSGFDSILPRCILPTNPNDGNFLSNPIPHSITRCGRRSKLEKDLEEAYLKILEKKKLGPSITPAPKKTIEDAQTQTEDLEKSSVTNRGTNVQNEDLPKANSYEEELNFVLEKLLKEHWEAIDEYFRPLLLGKHDDQKAD